MPLFGTWKINVTTYFEFKWRITIIVSNVYICNYAICSHYEQVAMEFGPGDINALYRLGTESKHCTFRSISKRSNDVKYNSIF